MDSHIESDWMSRGLQNTFRASDSTTMSSLCKVCAAPLESDFFTLCAHCEIEKVAADARQRLQEAEPWERLPERWRRLADGWTDFPEEFQAELRDFLIENYEERADEVLGQARYDGRLAPRTFAKPEMSLDVFDDPVAQEWADAG